MLSAYDDAIDGIAATDDSNVRMLVNLDTWKYIRTLQIDTSGSLLRDRLPAGRFRASANMPAGAEQHSHRVDLRGRRGARIRATCLAKCGVDTGPVH